MINRPHRTGSTIARANNYKKKAEAIKPERVACEISERVDQALLGGGPIIRTKLYPYRDMTPQHPAACFDAFGPQRCYWGTDMTNSFAKATYRQRVTHFTETLPISSSEDDKDWVMGRALISRG